MQGRRLVSVQDVLAVDVLVQAVEVVRHVLQQERRGLTLPGRMAAP